jgi:predicted dehydrogenase
MEKTYRAALVGLGNIAWRFDQNVGGRHSLTHASAYVQNHRTSIVGGCSPDEGDRVAFERTFGVLAYKTLEKLIDETEPDIVSICSPSGFHYRQVVYCLEKEISMIWLEKPPAGSLSELDALLQAQTGRGGKSKVLVNYQRRYAECYRLLKTLYRDDVLGKCRFVHINYSRGLELNGSHILDMLFFIAGDGAKYELEWISTSKDLENPSFALTLENGVEVIVSGLSLPYHCIDISLVCDKGRISVLHGGMTPRIEKKVEHELFPGFYRLKESEEHLLGPGGFGACMEEALKDLINAFEGDLQLQSGLATARNAQALVEEVRQKREGLASI